MDEDRKCEECGGALPADKPPVVASLPNGHAYRFCSEDCAEQHDLWFLIIEDAYGCD